MKQIKKIGLMCGLTLSSSAFCLNPVTGLYFGLLGQISHAPNTQLGVVINNVPVTGNLTLSPVGGGVGAALGYKVNTNFRLEGEFLFNINNYGQLQVGNCTLISPTVVGPEGTCSAFVENNALGFNGNTLGFYGLFNVYYDFLSLDSEKTVFPYIGLGLGGALIKNHALIATNNQAVSLGATPISATFDSSQFGLAAQGIIGVGWYIDDFTTIGLDFRYVSAINTSKSNNVIDGSNTSSQYGIGTINFTGTFVLDRSSSNN